jgi:hypothetical protein
LLCSLSSIQMEGGKAARGGRLLSIGDARGQ